MQQISPDGAGPRYEDVGSGDPPIVFVHGLSAENNFVPQIEHFARRHRVVTVELHGFDGSESAQHDFTIAGFADDVSRICSQLDLRQPVLVGHSMGGAIVFELAGRMPDLPSAILLIDTALCWAPFAREPQARLAQALSTEHYAQAFRGFAEMAMFLPTDDAALKSRVVDEMSSLPQDLLRAALVDYFDWTAESAAPNVVAPTLLITAGDGPPSDMARVRELCPNLEIGRVVGAGHFAHLLVPEQVNAMIERFLTVSRAVPVAT
jgi:pimeloyl-ACP methyl ester carboxylesterase